MNNKNLIVKVENDNSGYLLVIIVILFLIMLLVSFIARTLKDNFEQKPQTETTQTVEVEE